ncbi:hypothetical protein TRFO_31023 [Tritrichomonas foetus]|uniref:Protein kinase domain-containing protein n=1 Tax=Tritrichomonas foetus TaxID=1144522 RepID=A0A1J4JWU1_9EUKA|nr:hypothetical protein TRFO_31023 [Tritrichomonas foetus]|eukprot:OHT02004.1 hypothetical protein TRFO_31023 [Tritrichomonas foetus]
MLTSDDYDLGVIYHMFPGSIQFIARNTHTDEEVLFHIIGKKQFNRGSLRSAVIKLNEYFKNAHPLLCKQEAILYASLQTKPQFVITMPILKPFTDVFTLLKNEGKSFTATEFHIIAFGIAVAFHYLHCIGIVHGNFSDSCVYLNDKNEPYLYGHGFYQCISDQSDIFPKTTHLPEFIPNFHANRRSDVYEFGYFLRLMVAKSPPTFDKPIPDYQDNLPKSLVKLINRCLIRDSMRRPNFSYIVQKLGYNTKILLNNTEITAFEKYKHKIRKLLSKSKNEMAYGCFLSTDKLNSKGISKSWFHFSQASSQYIPIIIPKHPIETEDINNDSQIISPPNSPHNPLQNNVPNSTQGTLQDTMKNTLKDSLKDSLKNHLDEFDKEPSTNLQSTMLRDSIQESAAGIPNNLINKSSEVNWIHAKFYACYQLALFYKGSFGPLSSEYSRYLMEAAKYDVHDALHELALLNFGKDKKLSLDYLHRAAELGNVYSQLKLADMAKEEGNIEEAKLYFKMAALNGSRRAQLIYAELDPQCNGFLEAAASQGSFRAELFLAEKCKSDNNMKGYIQHLQSAARKRSLEALLLLGQYYHENKEIELSLHYYKQAVNRRSSKAAYFLCELFAYGNDVEQDLLEASHYLKMAAKFKNEKALKDDIADLDAADDDDSINYFKQIAKNKRAIGLLAIGRLYECGYRVSMNLVTAAKCYKKAANISSKGKIFTENMILSDDNEDHNIDECIRLYKYLSEKGNSTAQYRLAVCYHSGKGVNKDMDIARKYYQLAANKGSKQASQMLIQCFQQDTIMAFMEPKDVPLDNKDKKNSNNNINPNMNTKKSNNNLDKEKNDSDDPSDSSDKRNIIRKFDDDDDGRCCCNFISSLMGLSKLSRFFPIIFSVIRLVQACSVTVNSGENSGSAMSKFTDWATSLLNLVITELKIEPLTASQEALFLSCVFTYLLTFLVYGFLYGIEWLLISLIGSAVYVPAGVGIAMLGRPIGIWLIIISILALFITLILKKGNILDKALKIENSVIRIISCSLLSPFYLCYLCIIIINPKKYTNILCNKGMLKSFPRMNIMLTIIMSLCIINLIVLLIVGLSTIYYFITAVFGVLAIVIGILLLVANWDPDALAKSSSIFVMYCFHVLGQLFLLPCINLLCDDSLESVTIAFVTFFSVVVPMLSIFLFSIFPMVIRSYFHPFFIRGWMENAMSVSSVLCDKLKARFFYWPSIEYVYRVVYALCAKKATLVVNIAVSAVGFLLFVGFRPYLTTSDNILSLGEPMVLIILNSLILAYEQKGAMPIGLTILLFVFTFTPALAATVIYFIYDRKNFFTYIKKDLKHELDHSPIFAPKQIINDDSSSFVNCSDESSSLSFLGSSSYDSSEYTVNNINDHSKSNQHNNQKNNSEANSKSNEYDPEMSEFHDEHHRGKKKVLKLKKPKGRKLYAGNLPVSVRLENYLTKKLHIFKNFHKLAEKSLEELTYSDFGDQKFIHRRYDNLTISFYRYLNALIVSIGFILLYALISSWLI